MVVLKARNLPKMDITGMSGKVITVVVEIIDDKGTPMISHLLLA